MRGWRAMGLGAESRERGRDCGERSVAAASMRTPAGSTTGLRGRAARRDGIAGGAILSREDGVRRGRGGIGGDRASCVVTGEVAG